jgi:hypothetical protein
VPTPAAIASLDPHALPALLGLLSRGPVANIFHLVAHEFELLDKPMDWWVPGGKLGLEVVFLPVVWLLVLVLRGAGIARACGACALPTPLAPPKPQPPAPPKPQTLCGPRPQNPKPLGAATRELVRRLGSRAAVVAAPRDVWCPRQHYEELLEQAPGLEVREALGCCFYL